MLFGVDGNYGKINLRRNNVEEEWGLYFVIGRSSGSPYCLESSVLFVKSSYVECARRERAALNRVQGTLFELRRQAEVRELELHRQAEKKRQDKIARQAELARRFEQAEREVHNPRRETELEKWLREDAERIERERKSAKL